ncbi:MAG: hypothetical protein AB7H90_01410 [Alphaproteobacteria bacterium]
MNREVIYSTLFTKVTAVAKFVTKERRLRHWSDVAPAEQPALFMVQEGEDVEYPVLGAPGTWTFRARLYLYVHTSDPYASPSVEMNKLVDAVQDALKPPPIGHGGRPVQTLGLEPVVQHCWIEGTIETDEGVLGDQTVAIIPVNILCVG